VQAYCTFNGTLSSSTIAQGTGSVGLSGTDGCGGAGRTVSVVLASGACGSPGTAIFSGSATIDANNNFALPIPTSTLSPGSYCVVLTSYSCLPVDPICAILIDDPLTVTAVPQPAVHPVYVGGVMFPSVGFTVLLPWAVLLSLLGVLSVEAFTIKRRAKRR
jgi:hypothetical protein